MGGEIGNPLLHPYRPHKSSDGDPGGRGGFRFRARRRVAQGRGRLDGGDRRDGIAGARRGGCPGRTGLKPRVINVSTVKPLDEATIIAAARETGAIVTVEEAAIEGGLGAAVAETVVRNAPVPMRILGVNSFAPTGKAAFLFDHFGLNRDGIVAAALELKSR